MSGRIKGCWAVLLPLLLLPVAARAQQTREPAPTNVPIIENRTPAWTATQRWRLSAQPTLDIGTDMHVRMYRIEKPAGR
jgi:hypothetical protein